MWAVNNTIIHNFKPTEFSEDPQKYAHPNLIINLDKLRDFIKYAIYPSPVKGALARFDDKAKNSQHYSKYRLSTAIDVFISGDPFIAFIKILHSGLFNGTSCYFDTIYKNKPWIMFHLDLREKPLLWYRDKGKYYYTLDGLLERFSSYDKI